MSGLSGFNPTEIKKVSAFPGFPSEAKSLKCY